MYNDDTILIAGKYKFTKLIRVPAEYLLKVYSSGNKSDKELFEYVQNNLETIIARKEGRIPTSHLKPLCDKQAYVSKKVANLHLSVISKKEQDHKKPVRSYECDKCGAWHVTSIPYEHWEKNPPWLMRRAM